MYSTWFLSFYGQTLVRLFSISVAVANFWSRKNGMFCTTFRFTLLCALRLSCLIYNWCWKNPINWIVKLVRFDSDNWLVKLNCSHVNSTGCLFRGFCARLWLHSIYCPWIYSKLKRREAVEKLFYTKWPNRRYTNVIHANERSLTIGRAHTPAHISHPSIEILILNYRLSYKHFSHQISME